MDNIGRRHAQQHDGRSAAHQRHAAVLERGEETGTHLQADGEDEENQTEFLDEVQDFVIDRHVQAAQGDAHEKDPRDAERHAADLDLAEQNAQRDGQRENQHRMGDAAAEEKGFEPLHRCLFLCLLSC